MSIYIFDYYMVMDQQVLILVNFQNLLMLKKFIQQKTPMWVFISKKREQKLTVSRALSDKIETRSRSLASLKRAKQKENRDLKKADIYLNRKLTCFQYLLMKFLF